MKIKRKKDLTFGEVVMAITQVWGADRADKMLRLAIKKHVVVLRDPVNFLLATARGRPA